MNVKRQLLKRFAATKNGVYMRVIRNEGSSVYENVERCLFFLNVLFCVLKKKFTTNKKKT